jgi:EAL and modified HD-GYP domain-containing signal transduction protein
VVATDLPGLEVIELALKLGVRFASGSMSAASEPETAPPISPAIQRLVQLLNRLLREEDPARLASDIKRDVSLSLQLLRHVSSVRYARGRTIDTVEAAVLLIGRDELYRWLSRVLVRSAGGRRTSRALQEVTLARARLLELLAAQRGEPHPASLFTLGLASMLPTLLNTSVKEALGPMELVPEARAALLEMNGPWLGYLELARALERQDFDFADGLAQCFGGLAFVLEQSEQAWAWTAEQDESA